MLTCDLVKDVILASDTMGGGAHGWRSPRMEEPMNGGAHELKTPQEMSVV